MDRKISELDQALQINNDAVFPFSQDNSGEDTTYKASITQLGTEIGEDMTFSNLQTSSKKLVGAINEIAQGGGGGGGSSNHNIAPDYDDTSTYAVGDWCIYEGNLYQCNTAIPTAEAFTPAHWTAKKVVDALDDIENELDDKVDKADYTADMLPITSGGVSTKSYIDSQNAVFKSVWSGSIYQANDTAQITDFNPNKIYTIRLWAFSGVYTDVKFFYGSQQNIQFAVQGDSTQYCRYRLTLNSSGLLTIIENLGGGSNTAILDIFELTNQSLNLE